MLFTTGIWDSPGACSEGQQAKHARAWHTELAAVWRSNHRASVLIRKRKSEGCVSCGTGTDINSYVKAASLECFRTTCFCTCYKFQKACALNDTILFLTPPKNHRQLAVPGSDLPVDRKQMANWAVFWRSKKEKRKKGLLLVANKSQGTAQLESGIICLFYFFSWISYRIIRIEKRMFHLIKKKRSYVSRCILSVKAPVFIHRGPEGN